MKHAILLAVILIGSVAASTGLAEYRPTAKEAFQQDTCLQAAVASLRQATNPDVPEQEWHLNAAEAYLKLSELDQTC